MSCCGQKREELRSGYGPALTPQTTAPIFGAVLMQYLERSPVRVQGAATGRVYSFSGSNPIQAIAASDANALEQSRAFRRVR